MYLCTTTPFSQFPGIRFSVFTSLIMCVKGSEIRVWIVPYASAGIPPATCAFAVFSFLIAFYIISRAVFEYHVCNFGRIGWHLYNSDAYLILVILGCTSFICVLF